MADEEQTVIDMQPTQEEEQHRQQQGGSSTWCHDCNFWICVHGEDTSCQCPDCNCECPDCSGLDCDCGGLDCTIMWTFEKKHNLYKITYFQVVPYKSIKNMLCPSNHSIRTSEQFTPRSKVRTPTKITSLNSISKMMWHLQCFLYFSRQRIFNVYFKIFTQVTEVIQESLYFGNYAMSTESIKAKVFYVQLW